MPLMVTIRAWVFITICWRRQYDFNLVHHQTPEKWFFSYSEKKHHQAGFEPGTPTMNPEHTHALDHSAMAPPYFPISFHYLQSCYSARSPFNIIKIIFQLYLNRYYLTLLSRCQFLFSWIWPQVREKLKSTVYYF